MSHSTSLDAAPPLAVDTDSPQGWWRSLTELEGDAAFQEQLSREFPRYASVWDVAGVDRRRFLQLLGASIALASMQSCGRPPAEQILPYVRAPQEFTPGLVTSFATAMPTTRSAIGLVVRSHMGRPVKIEGNPHHPASLGGTDAWSQAAILTFYSPDRSQAVTDQGEISTWDEFAIEFRKLLCKLPQGRGLHILSGPVTSPTLIRQRRALLDRYPSVKWYTYAAGESGSRDRAMKQAYGEALLSIHNFERADVVVTLDADCLGGGPDNVRNISDFMSRRAADSGPIANRLYAIESMHTATGAASDHRLALNPRELELFTFSLARRLGIELAESTGLSEVATQWVDTIAADLEHNRGRSVIIAGPHHPEAVHVLTHAINDRLGNVGSTITFFPAMDWDADLEVGSLGQLAGELNDGSVQLLLLLDVNPAYDAPADLEFARALDRAAAAVHFGLFAPETAARCRWHLPAAHFLEAWSDTHTVDGMATIIQPLIAPLYDGKSVHELFSLFGDESYRAGYDAVRDTWRERFGETFDTAWHAALSTGVIKASQSAPKSVSFQADLSALLPSHVESNQDLIDVLLLPDPTIGDGRFANNAWLQELPKPLTKLTWGNAVLMSVADAARIDVRDGDVVRLESEGRFAEGPVCLVPGHAAGCVTCHLGHGRTLGGTVLQEIGFNAYQLLTTESGAIVRGVTISRTDRHEALARTQEHFVIEGRNIIQSASALKHDSDRDVHPSLLPEEKYTGLQWGMAIDLTCCSGCNACVIACQAENNVPVVGREGVLRSREMHWLRIDTYFSGQPESPEAVHQPMLCQHCEKAPCELVCPVAATSHSDDGLNQMTYNRCIGTRYCSNNCPYKVRRFNFFEYTDPAPVLALMRNPDVTVRSRGVMEKCTYCVQRINSARVEAKIESVTSDKDLFIEDGTLQTACQQACPAQAIVFGDINDPNSRVARLKSNVRNYGVLSELNTRPRTTYLAVAKNRNPMLAEGGEHVR